MNVKAWWHIELNVLCPKCDHRFDPTKDPYFWEDCSPIENGTPRTTDVAASCPKCKHEFLMDYEW